MQVAGSDQWGNIVAGVDLDSQKTSSRGLWADRVRSSPKPTGPSSAKLKPAPFGSPKTALRLTAFYQFWLNSPDAEVPKYLKVFTLLTRTKSNDSSTNMPANPGARIAHRALARHMTELLHGRAELERAQTATEALFW